MSAFTHMAEALRAPCCPFQPASCGTKGHPTTRTESIRQLLAERGALTAVQIAIAVDLDAASLVPALLKHDIATGRVERLRSSSPIRYSLSRRFDEEQQRAIAAAVRLLRRQGFTVRRKSP